MTSALGSQVRRHTGRGGEGKWRENSVDVIDARALVTAATESPASAVRTAAIAARPAGGAFSS